MASETTLKALLTEFKTGLRAIYESRQKGVLLYASFARGDQEEESDLDQLIGLDCFTRYWAEVDRTGYLGSDLSLKSGVSISRVFVTERDWKMGDSPFLENVREDALAA